MVDTNDTRFNQSAVLMSPPYNRSRDWPSKCLRFRYMLRGPGEKALTIYQKANSYREIPIWISKRNTGHNWIYGQVALSSVSNFQVTIDVFGEGEGGVLIFLLSLIPNHSHHGVCLSHPNLPRQVSNNRNCGVNSLTTATFFFNTIVIDKR